MKTINSKKNSKKFHKNSKKETKAKVISVAFSEREIRKLESLAALTDSDISKVIRACVKQNANVVRQAYLKKFVKTVEAMPDPFGDDPVFDHSAGSFEDKVLAKELAWKKECERSGSVTNDKKIKYADKFSHGMSAQDIANSVDEADRELAENTPHLSAANWTDKQRQEIIKLAHARLERIFWLMDGPESEIPVELRGEVFYWRDHEAQGRELLNRALKEKYPYLM